MTAKNQTMSDLINEIESAVTDGKNLIKALEADDDGSISGTEDVIGAFDDISRPLDDLRGRLHGWADTIGNLESELSDV